MKVEKKPYKSAGSCNFCSRGITSDDDIGIVKRPYDSVWLITGESIKIRFCNKCLTEAAQFVDKGVLR